MKETAIIYIRKSTDREELQQNSLEHQLNNCRNTASLLDLEVIDEISESKSAKDEFTRAGFNRMIEKCLKWKIDYIIIDETKRLSRNWMDSQRAIGLMDKHLIKWIIATGRKFLSDNSTDKFMLLFELWYSKKDNEDRSKDVKGKMITALNRGQWLWKAIYGYRNVTIKKGHKDVKYIEEEADVVRQAFIMRSQGKGLSEIGRFISEKSGQRWTAERVSKMLKNTKYFGLQRFWGQEALLDSPWYKPIISKALFEQVNGIERVREYKKNEDLPRYFVGLLKDTEGNNLYPYEKKGKYIYYHNGNNTQYRVNISQANLFKAFEEHIENYTFPLPFIRLSKATLKQYYQDKLKNREVELRETSKKLTQVDTILESLVEKYLSNDIDKETYEVQKIKYQDQKRDLEEKYKAIKQGDDNVVKIIEDMCELVENLSETYKSWNEQKKGEIIRAMQCELIFTKQKELVIKENKLFETIRLFNFQFWYSHGELNSGSSLEKAVS